MPPDCCSSRSPSRQQKPPRVSTSGSRTLATRVASLAGAVSSCSLESTRATARTAASLSSSARAKVSAVVDWSTCPSITAAATTAAIAIATAISRRARSDIGPYVSKDRASQAACRRAHARHAGHRAPRSRLPFGPERFPQRGGHDRDRCTEIEHEVYGVRRRASAAQIAAPAPGQRFLRPAIRRAYASAATVQICWMSSSWSGVSGLARWPYRMLTSRLPDRDRAGGGDGRLAAPDRLVQIAVDRRRRDRAVEQPRLLRDGGLEHGRRVEGDQHVLDERVARDPRRSPSSRTRAGLAP